MSVKGTVLERVQFMETVLVGPTFDPYRASLTLGRVPQQNNVLIMAVSFDSGNIIPQAASIMQDGVTWTLIHRTRNDSVVLGTELWYGVVGAGASPRIDITFNPIIQYGAFHGCIIQLAEYSGLRVPSPLDKYAWANGDVNLVTNPTSGMTDMTTQDNELWIAVIHTEAGYPQTNPTNGFTQLAGQTMQPGGFWSVSFFERIVTSKGQAGVSTTLPLNGFYLGNVATFFTQMEIQHTVLTILSASGGSTSPPAGTSIHPNGATVTVTASPSLGYRFTNWVLDGTPMFENPINILMSRDHTLQPVFSSVTPPPTGAGTLHVNAIKDSVEVAAQIEIVGVGPFVSPFSVNLPVGNYTLNASYLGRFQVKTAQISEGEVTTKLFDFTEAQPPPFYEDFVNWVKEHPLAVAGVAGIGVIAAAGVLYFRRRR